MSNNKQQDRVSYSFGFKHPGPEQYSSENVTVSYSTDIRVDETPEGAMERARAFVMSEVGRQSTAVVPKSTQQPMPSPRRIEDEVFDPNNQDHFRIAQNVFDYLNISSEKARAYKIHQLLPGCRVGDLRRIVEDDEAEFRNEATRQPVRAVRRDGQRSNWNGNSSRKRW
jgi:hypothetical protein